MAAAVPLVAALRRPLWPAEEMRTATMAPAMTAASQQPLCTSDLLLRLPMKQALAAAVRRPRCLTVAAALVLVAALRRPLWPAEEMRMATIAPEVTAASQQPLCMPDLLLRLPMK